MYIPIYESTFLFPSTYLDSRCSDDGMHESEKEEEGAKRGSRKGVFVDS